MGKKKSGRNPTHTRIDGDVLAEIREEARAAAQKIPAFIRRVWEERKALKLKPEQ